MTGAANTVPVATTPVFDRDAAGYDAMRRKLIPEFDGFYGAGLDLIGDWRQGRPLRVLDLGAGTGLFSAILLDRHPDATVHLVDASDGMLTQARQRLAGRAGVSFAIGDMTAGAPWGGPWDVVISALAIHHLEDDGKRALFHNVYGALRPDGLFVNAEQVAGPSPAMDARYARIWLQQIIAAGAPEDEIARAHQRMSFDRCATVEDQLAWLRAAGFVDVDCLFKAWRFAVLAGRK